LICFFSFQTLRDVYAMGDCAEIEGNPLMATAQVAVQQARYLAKSISLSLSLSLFSSSFQNSRLDFNHSSYPFSFSVEYSCTRSERSNSTISIQIPWSDGLHWRKQGCGGTS
jgi:NADH dehydrogenase FAD-containing subunit